MSTSTMHFTPGVRHLFTNGPSLVAPPLFVHLVLRYVAHNWAPFHLSRALIALVWTVTLPLYWYLHAIYTHFYRVRDARRLGAKLAPAVNGKWPGNIDLLWSNYFARDLYLGDGFAKAIDVYGTVFSNSVLGDYRVISANPDTMKQILATEFDSFEKGPKFNHITGSVLGEGVFNSDGEMWQFHRKITRPFFAKERITDFRIFDAKATTALQQMQKRFDEGEAIDFQDICSRFTIDSAWEFLLGSPIQSLLDPLPRPGVDFTNISTPSNRFARAFGDAQMSISTRGRIGITWPLFETFKDRTEDDMKEVRGFIEPVVREAMKRRAEGVVSDQEDSLLQHLLNVTQDMKLIIDETVNIMLAGRDTTACLLTFVAYCLAMHPEVLARLRAEVLSTVGPSRAPTFDDVRGMKYLRAVINETLRLFPSVPFNNRHTRIATTLTDEKGEKFYVPAHTRILFSSMLAQRHKPYWGEDAHLFDPDRFLDDRVRKYVTPNPFIFIPFSAGPRICLGQQFAYHEASFFITRLLQRYDGITLAPECLSPDSRPPASWRYSKGGTPRKALEECVLNSHLTLFVQGGLWLRMGLSATSEDV